ncbi:MAG: hypothetical protein KGK08_07475 [Acidobacteriota bacterium]|nr:hypothetical protein [Acidobacteriota bacterium]
MSTNRHGTWRWLPRGIFLGLVCMLAGCHRRPHALVLPQAMPVELAPTDSSVNQITVQPDSAGEPPQISIDVTIKPRRRRVRPQPAPQQGAGQPATDADDNGTVAIGELTAGEDSSAQTRQDATDLIAENNRQLARLSAQIQREKRTQINKIRNFQHQAQAALDSGDAEGAKTLATKARLMLFDLSR